MPATGAVAHERTGAAGTVGDCVGVDAIGVRMIVEVTDGVAETDVIEVLVAVEVTANGVTFESHAAASKTTNPSSAARSTHDP